MMCRRLSFADDANNSTVQRQGTRFALTLMLPRFVFSRAGAGDDAVNPRALSANILCAHRFSWSPVGKVGCYSLTQKISLSPPRQIGAL